MHQTDLYLKRIRLLYIMEYQNEIHVNGLKFRVHPGFDQYGGSECGKIVNIDREAILLGNPTNTNYLQCWVRAKNKRKQKMVLLHRFIWECYNGWDGDRSY